MKEFNCLWILFTSDGKSECEIDRRTGPVTMTVLRPLRRSETVKQELSHKNET